ncbi:MAG: 50S ribosomal protein L9 [Gammaproteobacteria bacterium]
MQVQVILTEKIRGLGNLGQAVKVKRGYARNYLYPQRKAVPATEENMAKIEAKRAELEKRAAGVLAAAQERATKLAELVLEITAKASEEGKLFGSIGTREIAEAISEKGCKIEKHEVQLPLGSLRQTGEYDVMIELHSDLIVPVKVKIIAG